MLSTLRSMAGQTSLAAGGFALILGGMMTIAFAAAYKADRDFARLPPLTCELRITASDGTRQTIARGHEGESCPGLAARVNNDRIPRDYRALWFELVPEE